MDDLPDIQKTPDTRGVAIQAVGVSGIRVPIRLKTYDQEPAIPQHTVAEFSMGVYLDHTVKGTHMSRFSQVLMEFLTRKDALVEDFNIASLHEEVCNRLFSPEADIKAKFAYFVTQYAPETKTVGIAPVEVVLEIAGSIVAPIETTTVIVHGKTVCPCSREISEFDDLTGKGKGAHAQRSTITLSVSHDPKFFIKFEDLIAVAQKSFSSPVYPVLKRPDERAVTMSAYDNPKFVEDVIRDVVVNLRAWNQQQPSSGAHWFTVRVENAESIHYHDAYAELTGEL